MDSTLILEHLERLVPENRRLTPPDIGDHARAQRVIGLALAVCEKTVQIVYERNLRPEDKQHQPWIDRVQGQLLEACRLLDAELGSGEAWLFGPRPLQADITAAVAWRFTRNALPGTVPEAAHPALRALSQRAEALPEFASTAI